MDQYYIYKKDMPYYDEKKIFYVCSFGGSGSKMLCEYLAEFGKVYHIHSRNPPIQLTKTGYDDKSTYAEWFNRTLVPEDELSNYKVIFIYRNPLQCIYSRINHPSALQNIQSSNINVTIKDVLEQKKDLYELEDFFDRYTKEKLKNYPMYCVKYEFFWDNIAFFNKVMNIPDIPDIYPKKNEIKRPEVHKEELKEIYKSLCEKMDKMNFIEIR